MIKINLLVIGNLKEKYLKDMNDEYLKRLSKYAKLNIFEFNELDTTKVSKYSSLDLFLDKEDEVILNKIKKDDVNIVLDLHGKSYSSEEFSSKLKDIINNLRGNINIIIGGTMGISNKIRNIAHIKIKLSDLTFTHQIARILILEQLYRAFKINNNESYHH